MNALCSAQHIKSVSALWAGYTGMLICVALENRLSDNQETFRPGPGRVKDIAT